MVREIIELINADFPNGIRDDVIDTNKILRLYSEKFADQVISNKLVTNVIHNFGVEHDGRFYFVSAADIAEIKDFFAQLFEKNNILYYAEIFSAHADFFSAKKIFSPEVLRKILRENDDRYFYFPEFCAIKNTTRLDDELTKTLTAAQNPFSLDDLRAIFPYVPTDKILHVLSDTENFLKTDSGKYLAISKIQFDADEINDAKNQIRAQIAAKGYATHDDFNLSANFALNPGVPEKVIRRLVYEKYFAADFIQRNKKFVSPDAPEKLTPTQILRNFLADKDQISTEELSAFARTLTAGNSRIEFAVAAESMTRVEKNLFVRDSLIKFDVPAIDDALSPFVQGKIISIRNVTSFTGFPPVAPYSWNLFLLESFLRKFSQNFACDSPSFNSLNVGAIFPKSMHFKDYRHLQAAVVAQENITLDKNSVDNFLVAQGYRVQRIANVTEDIIRKAQKILDAGNF